MTVANWVFAETTDSSDPNEILHGGWSSDGWCSFKVRISSISVKRLRSCVGRNLPITTDLAVGLYGTSRDGRRFKETFIKMQVLVHS